MNRRSQIGSFLQALGPVGFSLHDRAVNYARLPADEATAAALGAAMHRGPHPRYNDVVAARLERIRRISARARHPQEEALRRIARLQRSLLRVLAGDGPRLFRLNRRDPMHLFADYSSLDAAISMIDQYCAGTAGEQQAKNRKPGYQKTAGSGGGERNHDLTWIQGKRDPDSQILTFGTKR